MIKTTFKALVISLTLLISTQTKAQFSQLGQDLYGEAASDFFGTSVDLTPNGQFLVVGASNNANTASNAGNTRVFRFESGNWVQIGNDINGSADSDLQGSSVAISDDGQTVVIGAYQNDDGENNAGAVYVYHFDGSSWTQIGSTISGTVSSENRGRHVDINADGTIISTSDAGNKVGIKFYQFNGTNWIAYGNDIAVNDIYYTMTLSSDGNTLIIGDAYGNGDNGYGSGLAVVYTNTAGTWSLKGDTIWGEAAFDHFGTAVAINDNGSQIIVSAPNNDNNINNAGQVKVFNFDGTNWTQKGADLYGYNDSDLFGSSVDISNNGNTIAVGATDNDEVPSNSGQTRLYNFVSGAWQQTGNNINGEADGDKSGSAIAISATGDTIAIAARYNDDAGNSAGQVRVYTNCNSSSNTTISACESYTSPSGDDTWYTTGIYEDVIPNTSGCDSLITINLTITHSNTGTDTQTACDSFTWIDGNTYTSNNNTATYTLTNSVGCDSLITLDLTIETIDTTVTQNSDTLIANQTGVNYQWVDCSNANTPISGAINQIFVAQENGNYAVEISNGVCSKTSECYNITGLGFDELENKNITIYPNPAKQFVNIITSNSLSINKIIIYDITGVEVLTDKNISKKNLINVLKFQAGTYFIKIISTEKIITKKLIINN